MNKELHSIRTQLIQWAKKKNLPELDIQWIHEMFEGLDLLQPVSKQDQKWRDIFQLYFNKVRGNVEAAFEKRDPKAMYVLAHLLDDWTCQTLMCWTCSKPQQQRCHRDYESQLLRGNEVELLKKRIPFTFLELKSLPKRELYILCSIFNINPISYENESNIIPLLLKKQSKMGK